MSNAALILVGALLLAVGLGLTYAGKVGLDSAADRPRHVFELVGGIALSVLGAATIVGGVSLKRRTKILESS